MESKPGVVANILVVGGGLGGLAAGIAIRLGGHNVTVIESAKELAEIGAGVQITPQTVNVFKKWGLEETLGATAAEPINCTLHRYSDGYVLAEEPDWRGWMIERFGSPVWDLHRADMQIALWKKAESLGVQFKFGLIVESIDCAQGTVKIKDGDTLSADLVVAADGLHGMSRSCLLGRPDPARPTGDLAYRIVLNRDQISDADLLDMVVTKPGCHLWLGPKAHVVAYSLKAGQQYNVVLLVPDDLPVEVSRQKGDVNEMMTLFQGWDPILKRFLGLVTSVDKWRLMHHEGLATWHHPSGKFVMMGDAVHPMLPYLAQGANSAVEDGVVLGECLRRIQSLADIPKAIEVFERVRKPRSEKVVAGTVQQRYWNHLEDGPEQRARDALYAKQAGNRQADFPSYWINPEFWGFLCGYDPYQAAADGWAEYERQHPTH